jgi:2-succinyl-5-enolpyruvyl-6-hydroxy-3-cyclohexene-1-carboxylate synthase
MAHIPEKSLLHLAVGNTFLFAQRFPLRDDTEVFCNMGTNGIDGCTSAFMGQAAAASDEELCFLLVGDLSFFYDMNALWNKKLKRNMRIMLNNESGAGLLKHYRSKAITQTHGTTAKGWVKSLGFTYLSAANKAEFDAILPRFVSRQEEDALFFEVFVP